MSITAQSSTSISVDGLSFAEQTAQVSAEQIIKTIIDLPANSALNTGTLTTRTDNDDGIATLQTGHTIVTSGAKLVDVYWDGGSRHGMTATKTDNDVQVEGGTGDNLPAGTTPLTLCTQLEVDPLSIEGDNVEWLAVVYSNPLDTAAKAYLDLHDSVGTEKDYNLVHYQALGGCQHVANVSGGDANPIAGDSIVKAFASHTSAVAAKLYVLVLIDPTA